MKLLTKKIKEKAIKQYVKGADLEQMVVAKFFNPYGRGICHLYEWEVGSFSLEELRNLPLPFGFKIERDLYFKPIKASKLWEKLTLDDYNKHLSEI